MNLWGQRGWNRAGGAGYGSAPLFPAPVSVADDSRVKSPAGSEIIQTKKDNVRPTNGAFIAVHHVHNTSTTTRPETTQSPAHRMPGLTITTHDAQHSQSQTPSGSGSPTGPPISPITPTLAPAQLPPPPGHTEPVAHSAPPPSFAQDRPTFTHKQPDQIGMPPPPVPSQPISLDENPDVLAIKSAISILQMQRARATRDIQTISRARDAALADPEGFIADLTGGRIAEDAAPEDEDEEDSDSGEEGVKQETDHGIHKRTEPSSPPAWRNLPKPQNVVRCPPINWSQYGVVGESLDKLHAEQVRAPTQGTPATLTPGVGGGLTYEFKGGDGKQERLVGVAAPYDPLRDKVTKKGRGGKR